jgi:hypothetical protein
MTSIFKNTRDDNKGKIQKKGTEVYEKKIDKLLKESKSEVQKIRNHIMENGDDEDVSRDVLVRLSSLVDFFFSEIMKYIVPSLFKSNPDLPGEWSNFQVPMKDIRTIVDEWDDSDIEGKWIEEAYYNSYFEKSNQALKNIKKVFNLIKNKCFDDFIRKHEQIIKTKLNNDNLCIKQNISNFYNKRNFIVHSYDYKFNSFPKRNKINKQYILDNLDFYNELFTEISKYIKTELSA